MNHNKLLTLVSQSIADSMTHQSKFSGSYTIAIIIHIIYYNFVILSNIIRNSHSICSLVIFYDI